MSIIYKTLFEIKLLHEYFLTRRDGSTIFEKPTQQDRLDYLQKEFNDNQGSINNDIVFEFPHHLQSKYDGLFLKLLPTYSGCRVAVRVKPKRLPDQSLVFESLVPLTNVPEIFILISRKKFAINLYTNSRIKQACPSTYFFSNADLTGSKTFPFLTNSIPLQDASILYEQGELSLSGTDIQEYYREGGADKWNNVVGRGFANESDRLLLPEKFTYCFSNTTGLTEAIFTLKDHDGNEISSTTKNSPVDLAPKVTLDFSGKVKSVPAIDNLPLAGFIHTLEVAGNNGLADNHKIIFSNELSRTDPWGVLAIRPVVTNNAFNLIANDGFFVRRKDALGVWTPAPIFEVPLKSRLAYWRYINNRGKELNISPPLTDYVNKEGDVLVTRKPRSLSRSWFFLRKEASNDTQYVPNPVSPELRLGSDRRLFFDVVVPQSELFPEAP